VPITVAARSKAWTVFARSYTDIVGSNPTTGTNVCLFCVHVVLCVGSGLPTGWSPVQGVLSTVYRIRKTEKEAKAQLKGCRAYERIANVLFTQTYLYMGSWGWRWFSNVTSRIWHCILIGKMLNYYLHNQFSVFLYNQSLHLMLLLYGLCFHFVHVLLRKRKKERKKGRKKVQSRKK
jgi:hypothetical protein